MNRILIFEQLFQDGLLLLLLLGIAILRYTILCGWWLVDLAHLGCLVTVIDCHQVEVLLLLVEVQLSIIHRLESLSGALRNSLHMEALTSDRHHSLWPSHSATIIDSRVDAARLVAAGGHRLPSSHDRRRLCMPRHHLQPARLLQALVRHLFG